MATVLSPGAGAPLAGASVLATVVAGKTCDMPGQVFRYTTDTNGQVITLVSVFYIPGGQACVILKTIPPGDSGFSEKTIELEEVEMRLAPMSPDTVSVIIRLDN